MMYIPNIVKIGSGIQTFIGGTHTHRDRKAIAELIIILKMSEII